MGNKNRNVEGAEGRTLTSDAVLDAAALLIDPEYNPSQLTVDMLGQMKVAYGKEFVAMMIDNWFEQHDA